MIKFKENMKVVVIEYNKLRKGVIDKVYEDLNIAIVKFDDGDKGKVHFSKLGIEPDTKVQETKPIEPVEKSEITITPDEFRNISTRIIVEETDRLPVALLVGNVVAKIHEKLFIDEVDNE